MKRCLPSLLFLLSVLVGRSNCSLIGTAEPRKGDGSDNQVDATSGYPLPDNGIDPIVEAEERSEEHDQGEAGSDLPPHSLQIEPNATADCSYGNYDPRDDQPEDGSPCANATDSEEPESTVEARSLDDRRGGSTVWYTGPIHVPSTYGYRPTYRPQVPEVKLFLCNFEKHDCGMRNQPIVGHYFYRVSTALAGRRGHYMAVDARYTGYGVSRLITPYLPGYPNATACLSFNFIISGPGASKIQMIAQDRSNRPLFVLEQNAHRWDEFSVRMDVPQDVRFFIEAYTTDKGSGVIGIDNFIYHFGHCAEPGRVARY